MAPTIWISRNIRRDEHSAPQEAVPAEPHGTNVTVVIVAVVVILAVVGLAGAIAVWHRRRTKGHHGGQQRAFGEGGGPSLDGAKAGFAKLWYNITNPRARSKTAGFEGISAGRAGAPGTRGGAARGLDPDEAWDTRVGNEADFGYYEGGTELQGTTSYNNSAYRNGAPAENPFADEHSASGAGGLRAQNPFADDNAEGTSMRSVSPRPVVDTRSANAAGHLHTGDSPSKKSAFKENI